MDLGTYRGNAEVACCSFLYSLWDASDLKGIQKKAMEKGLPYQTLLSGMIHQYVEGDLVERKWG
jgi:hypothetical protein